MGLMAHFLCFIFMIQIFLLTSGVKSRPTDHMEYSTEQVDAGLNQTMTNGTQLSIKEVDSINNTTAASITNEKSTEKLDLPLSPDKINHEIDLFVKEMSNTNSYENSTPIADPNIASMDNTSKQDMSQEKLDQEIDLFLEGLKDYYDEKNATSAPITKGKLELDQPVSTESVKHETDQSTEDMNEENTSKQEISQEKLDQEIDLFLEGLKDYYDEKNATSAPITKGKLELDQPVSTESVKHETDQFTKDMNEENKSNEDTSREKLDHDVYQYLKDLKDYYDEKNSISTMKDKINLDQPMSTESLEQEIDKFIEDMSNNHKNKHIPTTTTSDTTNLINEQDQTRATSSSISHTEAHESAALGSESQAHDTAVKKVNVENDVTWALVAGACASGLLIILALVVMFLVLCYRRNSCCLWVGKKDCNRWDPQLLRPSKKNIDAFIFGTPIPSVSEMIKQ